MNKTIIAVDPGAGGAVCITGKNGAFAVPFNQATDMCDVIREAIMQDEHTEAIIELVGGFVGVNQPGSAMFNFGKNAGLYEGMFMAFGIPFRHVRPQEWQKGLPGLQKLKGPARKRRLNELAKQMFPSLKPTPKTCDAILIADWAKRNLG